MKQRPSFGKSTKLESRDPQGRTPEKSLGTKEPLRQKDPRYRSSLELRAERRVRSRSGAEDQQAWQEAASLC